MSKFLEIIQISGNTKSDNLVNLDNIERIVRNDATITIHFVSGQSIMADPSSLDKIIK